MRTLIAICVLLLAPLAARAQYTSVNFQVLDPNSNPYANGYWQANLDISGVPAGRLITFQGSTAFQTTYQGQLDGTGNGSASLPDNNVIVPVGTTKWKFQFCFVYNSQTGSPGPPCANLDITITGGSMNLTSTIQAIPMPAVPGVVSGFTAGLDLSGTNTQQQVIGIRSNSVPVLMSGYLHWNGTTFVWDTPVASLPTLPTTPNLVTQVLSTTPSGGVGGAAAWSLFGVTTRPITGTTSTDTILSTDCTNRADYRGSVAVATLLHTATDLALPNCAFRIDNDTTGSSTAVTVTPCTSGAGCSATWTITSGGSTGLTSLAIAQQQSCFFYVDPAGSAWDADCVTPSSGSGLSGMTATQVAIAGSANTITGSKALAGAGASVVTGPASSTSGDIVTYNGAGGQTQDSNVSINNVPTQASNASAGQVATYTSNNKALVPSTALPNGITATTQAPLDGSTDVSTDAYADAAVKAAFINPNSGFHFDWSFCGGSAVLEGTVGNGGFTDLSTGASVQRVDAPDIRHPCGLTFATNTTSGNHAASYLTFCSAQTIGSGCSGLPTVDTLPPLSSILFDSYVVINTKTISTSTGTLMLEGFADFAGVIANNITLEYTAGTDTDWQGQACKASTCTKLDLGIPPVVGDWTIVRIFSTVAGTIQFGICNSVPPATCTPSTIGSISTNVPTVGMTPVVSINNNSTANDREIIAQRFTFYEPAQ